MSRRMLALLAATAALAVGGCGDDEAEQEGTGGNQPERTATASATPDETPAQGGTQTAGIGRDIFIRTCASCHTLSDAGTNGEIGPNLDDLQPDADRVRNAIRTGPGAMPENLLSGDNLDAVAEYVAAATGG